MKASADLIAGWLDRSPADSAPLLWQKLEQHGVPTRKAALLVLKQASAGITSAPTATGWMEAALQELQTGEALSPLEILSCALAYEKLGQYPQALESYEQCIASLPASSLRDALTGMWYRVCSKQNGRDDDFVQAEAAFRSAYAAEQIDWRREKWRAAAAEMARQRIRKWK